MASNNTQQNYTSRVTENTDEFHQLEHYLSLSVANFGYVTNLKIWKISNSEMSTRFERKTGNCLRVSCWVDTATLPEGDTLDDLCRHGFRFHSIPGYYFRTGGLVDPPEHTSNNTHQFVYCEVAIGRSRVNDSIHPTTRIPAGFDSFYVPTEKLDRNEDGEFSISEYQAAANFNFRDARFYSHQYYVRDPLLVLPKYIVEYTLQPNPPISLPLSTDDSAADDIAGSSQFEYFDPVQYRPVTLQEKLTNSKIARRLMTIPQAYQFAYEEAKKATSELSPSDAAAPTALPNQKQQWIHEQLESVDEIFRQITLNYAENCEKITTCCENALMKLQGLTREKLELLLSIETELRRETEEINWVEHHLKQQVKLTEQLQQQNQKRWGTGAGGVAGGAQGLAAQLQFLKYWKNSIVIMNSLNRSHATETDMLNEIVPDMRVDCDIQVYLQQQRQEQQQAPLGSPSRSPAHATSGDRKMDPKGNRPSMLPNPLPLNKNISNLTVGDDDPTDQSPRPASPSHPLGSGSISQHVSAYDLQHFLGTLQRIDYYAPPTGNQEGGGGSGPRPSEPLISPSTQALVNVNLTKIENLINEIREDNSQKSVSGLLLPTSVTRPILSGIMYSVPGTVDNTFSSAGLDRNDSEDQIQRSLETSMRNVINLQQPQTTGLSALRGGGQLHRSSTLGAGGGSGVGGGGVGQAKRSSAMGLASSTGSPMMARKSIQPFAHSSSYLSGIDDQSQTDECSEQHPMGVSGYDIAHDQQSLDVIEQMLQLTAPYHQSYSLKEGSNKRQRQLSSTSFHFTEKYVFYGSQILTPVEAQDLYFNLPFFSRPPECKLAYSTRKHKRGLLQLYRVLQGMNHGEGPTSSNFVLVIQSGSFKFGAYLTQNLLPTSVWIGTPACFLFSLTLDLKFPYHGRNPPHRGGGNRPSTTGAAGAGAGTGGNLLTFGYYVDSDHIEIGNGDIYIDENMMEIYSELEGCYGVGLQRNLSEVRSLLGGANNFPIDELEVWMVNIPNTASTGGNNLL